MKVPWNYQYKSNPHIRLEVYSLWPFSRALTNCFLFRRGKIEKLLSFQSLENVLLLLLLLLQSLRACERVSLFLSFFTFLAFSFPPRFSFDIPFEIEKMTKFTPCQESSFLGTDERFSNLQNCPMDITFQSMTWPNHTAEPIPILGMTFFQNSRRIDRNRQMRMELSIFFDLCPISRLDQWHISHISTPV